MRVPECVYVKSNNSALAAHELPCKYMGLCRLKHDDVSDDKSCDIFCNICRIRLNISCKRNPSFFIIQTFYFTIIKKEHRSICPAKSDIQILLIPLVASVFFKPLLHRGAFYHVCKQSRPKPTAPVRTAWSESALFAYGTMIYLTLH